MMSSKLALRLSLLLAGIFLLALLISSALFMPRSGLAEIKAASVPQEVVLTGRDRNAGPALELLPGEKLDINSATAAELSRLPGIGEKLSQAIVDYRREHGAFAAIEEIMEVPGIGEGKFAAIKDSITIGDQSE